MAIYNRWNDEITIVANCGQHKPKGSKYSSKLVLATHSDNREAFYFIHTLKGETMTKVEEIANSCREIKLSKENLKKAIEEAS